MNTATITRILLNLCIALVLSLIVCSIIAYDDLPERIPTHFNGAGVADGFGDRSSWWTLLAIGVASVALTVGITMWLPRKPALFNIPNKADLLALPVEAQRAVVRQAQPGMLLLACSIGAVFCILQHAVWAVAQGRDAPLLRTVVFVMPLVAIAALPAMLIPVTREMDRQRRELGGR